MPCILLNQCLLLFVNSVCAVVSVHLQRAIFVSASTKSVANHLSTELKCMSRRNAAMGTMKLGLIANDLASSNPDDGKTIDFAAVGLYLPALQTVFATVLSAIISILACWMIPLGAISAVRTLALTVTSAVLVVRKPIKVGNTKGVDTIYAALRPCCFIYTLCLVLEQLVHTCVSDETTYEHGFWRRAIYNFFMSMMTLASFLRAKSPRSESDLPFLIATGSMLAIALLPPPALALSGPLCSPPTVLCAGERIVRAFLFSCLYVVFVYSAAPISNNLPDTIVCIARSATASCWMLGAIVYSLPLVIIQIVMLLYCSLSSVALQYEGISGAVGSETDLEASRICRSSETKEHAVVPTSQVTEHHEVDQSTMPLQRKNVCFQPVSGGGLTFNLGACMAPGSFHAISEQKRMAEVAASIQS